MQKLFQQNTKVYQGMLYILEVRDFEDIDTKITLC